MHQHERRAKKRRLVTLLLSASADLIGLYLAVFTGSWFMFLLYTVTFVLLLTIAQTAVRTGRDLDRLAVVNALLMSWNENHLNKLDDPGTETRTDPGQSPH